MSGPKMSSVDLKREFLLEASENIAELDQDLVLLEKGPQDLELIKKIYRAVHSLKGSSNLLGYKNLNLLSHSAENLLDLIREGKGQIEADILNVLFKYLDTIKKILNQLENDVKGQIFDVDETVSEIDFIYQRELKKAEGIKNELKVDKELEGLDDQLDEIIANTEGESNIEVGEISQAALESLREIDPSLAAELGTSIKTNLEGPKEVKEAKEEAQMVGVFSTSSPEKMPSLSSSELAPEKKSADLSDTVVRVNVKTLDRIMNIVGELVLNRNQLLQNSALLGDPKFTILAQQLDIITSELQSEIMATRMQPIASVLSRFERLIRDLSQQQKKKIKLELSGQETELDKGLLDAIKDPLVHIIRNAADHGIEMPAERSKMGKVEVGTISIRSYSESGQVSIDITDDGRGLSREKITTKAIEKGFLSKEQSEKMSDEEIFSIIFYPGFSTASELTDISGRGVGMDAVKNKLEKIGGEVKISSEKGKGTKIGLRIPLTLAIIPALIVRAEDEFFAFPQLNLEELVRLEVEDESTHIKKIRCQDFLDLRGDLLPLFSLSKSLGISGRIEEKNHFSKVDAVNILVLNAENQRYAVKVDEILDTQEIVVKPLGQKIKDLKLYGGVTIMGDGNVSLIIDTSGFLASMSEKGKPIEKEAEKKRTKVHGDIAINVEGHENLVFTLSDNSLYALALSLIFRLEEFKRDQVEKIGDRYIVRYLDRLLTLIVPENHLDIKNFFDERDRFTCVVTVAERKFYGIIITEIIDIFSESTEIDSSSSDRKEIIGSIIYEDRIVTLLDIYELIAAETGGPVRKAALEKISGRVLLVEDSAMYRKIEAKLLEDMGLNVTAAENGKIALDIIAREEPFDLVVTDIEMPLLDGIELTEGLRRISSYQNVPIIALTSRVSEKHLQKGKEVGFSYHLAKLEKEQFAKTVLEAIKPQKDKDKDKEVIEAA